MLLVEDGYQALFGKTIQERQAECPDEPHLSSCTDLLFFRYSPAPAARLKSGLTYDLVGLVTGMDDSTAKCLQNLGLQVLQYTLVKNGYAPKRKFQSVEEFKACFFKHSTIIIDATQQRTQRPGDTDYQKLISPPMRYSGKKKPTPSRQ